MVIRVFFNDKPAPISQCHSESEASSWRDAKVLLWAAAKLQPYEYAVAWADFAVEGLDNLHMRDKQVPADLSEDVAEHVKWQQEIIDRCANEEAAEDVVVEGLNSVYEHLGNLIGDHPDFVNIVESAARVWAEECLNNCDEGSFAHFNRYVAGDR